MGFLGKIRSGIKKAWSVVSGILVKAPIPAPVDELEAMSERDDVFSKARYKLMDEYGMTKDEATQAAREIAYTPEANVPDEYFDTWRVMYPE